MKRWMIGVGAALSSAGLLAGCTTPQPGSREPVPGTIVIGTPAPEAVAPVDQGGMIFEQDTGLLFPPLAAPAPLPGPPPGMLKQYTVKSGDMLSKIAVRFGVRSSEIMELNELKDPNRLRVGQLLYLPAHAKDVPAAAEVPAAGPAPAPRKPGPNDKIYTIRPGDSLSEIALAHGVTVRRLREANGLRDDRILAGRTLIIPAAAKPATGSETPPPEKTDAPPAGPVLGPTTNLPAPAPMPGVLPVNPLDQPIAPILP